MITASPVRHAPLALWQIARAFLETLQALFGRPEQIAARGALARKAHAQLASWLRCGEAMMRRLLLIEARAYAKPNTRPLLRAPRQRMRKQTCFAAEHPEAWRVSFRCLLDRPAGGAARTDVCARRRKTPPPTVRNAWPLAERYEALIRAFNDPAAHARRLSRRLHATPHRAAELLRAPPEAAHRIDRFADFASPPNHSDPPAQDSS
ncbi:MAG: hypothetical protein AB7T59_17790 [Hyphomonadaceae bacterium]